MISGARTPGETADCLAQNYAAVEALVDTMTPQDWDVQSLCPDWTCRDVVAHLVALERRLVGWFPTSPESPMPFDSVDEAMAETSNWSIEQLTNELRATHAARRQEFLGYSADQWNAPCPSPAGPRPYQGFMEIRAFDYWVHVLDIATPLGRVTDARSYGGVASKPAFDLIEATMGYVVAKKVGLPAGKSIAFELSGAVDRTFGVSVGDDGRAKTVAKLADPSVTITADALAFALLACGRTNPQVAIDEDRISWVGKSPDDASWGDTTARNLSFMA